MKKDFFRVRASHSKGRYPPRLRHFFQGLRVNPGNPQEWSPVRTQIAIIYFYGSYEKISESQLYIFMDLMRRSQNRNYIFYGSYEENPSWTGLKAWMMYYLQYTRTHRNSLSSFKADASELDLIIQSWCIWLTLIIQSVLGITTFVAFYFDYIYIIL